MCRPVPMDGTRWSRDKRGRSGTKSSSRGTLRGSRKLAHGGQRGFGPVPSRGFRRELLCSVDFPWPQEHSEGRAAWSGRGVLLVWMLSRDPVGSVEYGNHCDPQHRTVLLRGGQISRGGAQALRAEMDQATDSSAFEADAGRAPGQETGPTAPRGFSLCTPENRR